MRLSDVASLRDIIHSILKLRHIHIAYTKGKTFDKNPASGPCIQVLFPSPWRSWHSNYKIMIRFNECRRELREVLTESFDSLDMLHGFETEFQLPSTDYVILVIPPFSASHARVLPIKLSRLPAGNPIQELAEPYEHIFQPAHAHQNAKNCQTILLHSRLPGHTVDYFVIKGSMYLQKRQQWDAHIFLIRHENGPICSSYALADFALLLPIRKLVLLKSSRSGL